MSELSPAKTVDVQDWMRAPQTQRVMEALGRDELGRPQALFVGGCVRNMLLGQAVTDIDVATVLRPQEVTRRLEEAGVKVVPTGIEHGTVTAVSDGKVFEITSLRRDIETDGRRAVVDFTDDWVEDARRRDFTINTLLADMQGHVYDPTGQGLDDLAARRVVFVGDAGQRIAEDYLRALRFFRFHAWYGEGAPDATGLAACKAAAEHIAGLSKERITQEVFKILKAPEPAAALGLMFNSGILKALDFGALALLEKFSALQARYDAARLDGRMFVLAGRSVENLSAIEKNLLIPKALRREIESISQVSDKHRLDDAQGVKVAVYKCGHDAALQALLVAMARGTVAEAQGVKALEIIRSWDVPVFPVSGEDLIAQGFKPGPALGRELGRLEAEWIANGFR